jgi:acyl-ACP thioesterase
MGALELREKLIEQFNLFIQDDSKLLTLEGIFDSLNTSTEKPSLVPDEHYKIVEERRRKFHSGETKGASWNEVKQQLKDKYGF